MKPISFKQMTVEENIREDVMQCVDRITVIPYDPKITTDSLRSTPLKGGTILFDRQSRSVLALGKNDE